MKQHGVHSEARVEREAGRYVVYLDVFTVDAAGQPAGVLVKRISDHATEQKARVAAHWTQRIARKERPDPTGQ